MASVAVNSSVLSAVALVGLVLVVVATFAFVVVVFVVGCFRGGIVGYAK